jgi:hypothetical protein
MFEIFFQTFKEFKNCFDLVRTAFAPASPLLHFSASPLYRFADGWTDGRK